MQPKTLDFLVIGASKAGTTTLFRHLRKHPALYLPAGKDLPFFSDDERYRRGWPAAVDEFFAGAPRERLWGAVTPRPGASAARGAAERRHHRPCRKKPAVRAHSGSQRVAVNSEFRSRTP